MPASLRSNRTASKATQVTLTLQEQTTVMVVTRALTRSGLVKSQARTTLVRQLSQRPWAILANELAESGAMTNRSAHLRRSICSTGSPLFCQTCHSSLSPAEERRHIYNDSFIRQFRHEECVCLKGLSYVLLSNSKFQSGPHLQLQRKAACHCLAIFASAAI